VLSSIPIRLRLAAGFSIAMAVVLVALGALVYTRVDSALRHSVDQGLRVQATESARLPGIGTIADADARETGTIVELLSPAGRVINSSPVGLEPLLPPAQAARAARAALFTTIHRGKGEHNRWRVLGLPSAGNVVVVARSLSGSEETLRHVFRGLLVAGPIGLVLATLGGYLLAAAALRPVELMRRRAGAITADTQGARLPVPPARDEIAHLAETLNDMLARLELALVHERRFVADASHELRTPLSLLKAELELALRRPRTSQELLAAVGSAAEETDRLVRLAEGLLLVARSDQAELRLEREPFDLAFVARETAERFAPWAESTDRRIAADVAEGTVVDADRLRLEQAIGNLVDNALRHGAGTVTISASAADGSLVIHVADEGAGFEPGFAAHAFERFSRADEARSAGGSGLGLAIVDAIARAHGGEAGIAPAPTGGADVWLRLPHSRSGDDPAPLVSLPARV
jgi:signal transduction histidine kinase